MHADDRKVNSRIEGGESRITTPPLTLDNDLISRSEWLSVTLNSIGDAVISTDGEGRVNFMNKVAEDLTGWPEKDAAGLPLTEVFRIINEHTREPVENPALRALHEGVIVGLKNHTILIARNDAEIPIDDSAAPIRSAGGEIIGAVLIFRDITERHDRDAKLRESERRFRRMADTAPVLIWISDEDKQRTWFNKLWLDFVGQPLDRQIGWGWADSLHSDDRDRVITTYSEAFDKRESFSMEYRLRRHDGEYRWLLAHGTPRYSADQFNGYIGSCIDITERIRSEEALAQFAAIVESSNDVIVSKSLDGVITSWNPTAEQVFGYTAEEAVGQQIYFIIPDELRAEEADVLARLRRGEKIEHFETERITKDGRRLTVSLTVSPIRNSEGVLIGASKVARDITPQKQAEESLREGEQRLRLALEAGQMGLWEWNVVTNQVVWSPSLEAIHGLEPGTFPGTFEAFQRDIHPDDRQMVLSSIQQTLDDGNDHRVEYRIELPDGTTKWVESRGKVFRDSAGKPVRLMGVCADITSRKRSEEALRTFAAELSEADRKKNEFLAMLAHELRNPLAPLRNALQIMKITEGGDSQLNAAADMMERQVKHLVRLVDDLLDVSRISRGKIELRLERMNLIEVIEQAIEVAQPACDEGKIKLNFNSEIEDLFVSGDIVRLNQVIGNLLNNACKFTPGGGTIDVSLSREGDSAVIRVKDSGIGLDRDQLESVFDMFVQADTSLARPDGGLGIGLTLAKSLVEMLGGSVEARSEGIGRGSEFIVRLPIAEETEPGHASLESKKPEVKAKKKILVVDDNVDSADSLALLLEISGHEVRKANDGRDAVDIADEFRPDVILLDIGLPGLNGYDAARAIRGLEWGSDVALFALTGWGQKEDRERSKAAGFDVHMVKPIDFDELTSQLEEITAKNGE